MIDFLPWNSLLRKFSYFDWLDLLVRSFLSNADQHAIHSWCNLWRPRHSCMACTGYAQFVAGGILRIYGPPTARFASRWLLFARFCLFVLQFLCYLLTVNSTWAIGGSVCDFFFVSANWKASFPIVFNSSLAFPGFCLGVLNWNFLQNSPGPGESKHVGNGS